MTMDWPLPRHSSPGQPAFAPRAHRMRLGRERKNPSITFGFEEPHAPGRRGRMIAMLTRLLANSVTHTFLQVFLLAQGLISLAGAAWGIWGLAAGRPGAALATAASAAAAVTCALTALLLSTRTGKAAV